MSTLTAVHQAMPFTRGTDESELAARETQGDVVADKATRDGARKGIVLLAAGNQS